MSKTWLLSWNSKFYNYKQLIEDYNNNKHSGIIFQQKGNARMVHLPEIDDIVYISCDKLKIMKCKVISNFTSYNESYITDIYDIYDVKMTKTSTSNNEYLKIKIIKMYNKPNILKGNQRTWSKYTGI